MFSRNENIAINYDVMLKNKVPILVNDEMWIKLFGNVTEKGIVNNKKELERLLQEDRKVNIELNKLKVQKKKLMEKILQISDEVNNKQNENYVSILEECQNQMLLMNEQIEDLTFKSETLPKQIREVNFELLKETVRYSYKQIKENQDKLESTNEKIERYRMELKELLEKKHDYEEKINYTYRFLHGTLGNKEMEKLDATML